MNKLNSSTIKYLGLIVFVCIVFMIIVGQAYNYLPVEEKNNLSNQATVPTIIKYEAEYKQDYTEQNQTNNTEDNEQQVRTVIEKRNKKTSTTNPNFVVVPELEPLESINKDNKINSSSTSEQPSYDDKLKTAKKFRKNREFEKAIVEYQTALELAENEDEKAFCYEEIANTFAITKRYGSAITYAQKAYKIKPTSSVEVLLARLYYKTGNIEKATNRINFILKKDFNVED